MNRANRSRRHGQSKSSVPTDPDTTRSTRLVWLWPLIVLAVGLAFRPIRTDDLWWELSRGREVLRGTVSPSRDLLALDEQREADWLGGVPWFAVYSSLGATGLMLVRLACVTAATWLLAAWSDSHSPAKLLAAMSALVCLDSSLDPGPALWDVAFAASVAGCAAWRIRQPSLKTLLAIGLCFLVGANVAPRFIWGFLILLALLWRGRSKKADILAVSGLALLASCVTPRGVATLWDSLRMFAPILVAEPWSLSETPWQPMGEAPWNAELGALAVLLGCGLWTLRGQTANNFWPLAVMWLTAVSAVMLSTANVPLAAIALLCSLYRAESPTVKGRPEPRLRLEMIWHAAGLATIVATIFLWGGPRKLLAQSGWGIDARLDYRFLQLAVEGLQPAGTAWADDVRSAGALVWLQPGSIQVHDVPHRALLGGRWSVHVALRDDLRKGRKTSYYREDGSLGGWWLALEARQTTLLLFAAEDVDIIRELEPSLWKPLTFDSPVLMYASTADDQYVQPLLRVLQQRRFTDRGAWAYAPPQSTDSPFDRDRWGWRSELDGYSMGLRQARVFRAMGQRTAAMRVLVHLLRASPNSEVRTEVAACQAELAHAEFVVAGRASRFRELAAKLARAMTSSTYIRTGEPQWVAAVEAYLAGDWTAAQTSLTVDNLEAQYARATILSESGDPAAAIAILQNTDWEPDQRLHLLAHLLRDDLLQATIQP